MPSVFITGARGFIGAALARRYRADGWEVRGLDLAAAPQDGVVAGDVAERGSWQDAAAGCDLVVHTAAVVSMRVTGRDGVWRVNVAGRATRWRRRSGRARASCTSRPSSSSGWTRRTASTSVIRSW